MVTTREESWTRGKRAVCALALVLSLVALIQADHRARKGRSALLKWQPTSEALWAGEQIYDTEEEGYPTLPLSLILMRPFHSVGERAGAFLWALAKVGLAWWVLLSAFRLAAGRARDFPTGWMLLVLVLSFRMLHSDVQHGNLNMLVGAGVAAAAVSWWRRREFTAGLWIALVAVLKVTPLLFLLYFLWKRNTRALAGLALGLSLGVFVLPALFLGFTHNAELAATWWQQMILPYVSGRELGLMQTEHINQSLMGVLARCCTESVAIPAKPPGLTEDVYVNLFALSPGAFRLVHLTAIAAVLVVLLRALRPARERLGVVVLGEFALFAFAMLFLSERSWKQHYVLLAFPLAYLAWTAWLRPDRPGARRLAVGALLVCAALIGLTGSGVLGHHGSNLAEAYGCHFLAGLALYCAVAWLLRRDVPGPCGPSVGSGEAEACGREVAPPAG